MILSFQRTNKIRKSAQQEDSLGSNLSADCRRWHWSDGNWLKAELFNSYFVSLFTNGKKKSEAHTETVYGTEEKCSSKQGRKWWENYLLLNK